MHPELITLYNMKGFMIHQSNEAAEVLNRKKEYIHALLIKTSLWHSHVMHINL
jgi:acetyl-CoA carboxylase carboxyltransferase component